MQMRNLFNVKLITILLILAYIFLIPINRYTNIISAILVLFFSLFALYKSRNKVSVFLMFFFILYCNYSIIIGEYLVVNTHSSIIYTEAKDTSTYGITIKILLLFISILVMGYSASKNDVSKSKLVVKDNPYLFYSLVLVLTFIFIVGVNRGGNRDIYTVRITPLYEYSKLLFIFLYYYSGKEIRRKIIFTILIGAFILQDIYYGGRVTSLQLILLYCITILEDFLRGKKVIILGMLGVLFNSVINVYRQSFSIGSIKIVEIMKGLFETHFIFDTATHSYYASATHVAATNVIDPNIRLLSLFEFSKSIFFGEKSPLSNVTNFVSNNYYKNAGGGVLPSHFYFWLGWVGVIAVGVFLVCIINNSFNLKEDIQTIITISVIISVPRWYLYSPNGLLRGALLFTVILFFIFKFIHSLNIGEKLVSIIKNNKILKHCYKK